MASTSTETTPAATKMVLTPVITLEDHEDFIQSMSYFPDGKRMISASDDLTVRHWDMRTGKEIKEARNVCKWEVRAVMVSRDGRWVIIAGGDADHAELKACEVETGITKTFLGHSGEIKCIDTSSDGTLLASGSGDGTTRIWVFGTGKLMAGPFKGGWGAVRFSQDSKKLALYSDVGNSLDVWDVRTQKLQAGVQGKAPRGPALTNVPVFWTSKGTIVAAFNFTDDGPMTIYEFDVASTLETVGASFKGHTDIINALALSSNDTLLFSGSRDDTIKIWAFESRQLLASFHVQNPKILILSPDSQNLAYTMATYKEKNIYICNIPVDILTSIGGPALEGQSILPTTNVTLQDPLQSDATRRPVAVRRNPVSSPVIYPPKPSGPLPTRNQQQHTFLHHFRNFISFSSRTDEVPSVHNDQPRDPLDIPATITHGGPHMDPHEISQHAPAPPTVLSDPTPISFGARLSNWFAVHARHVVLPIVDVPLAQGKQRNAAAGAPKENDDLVPDEYFDDDPPLPDSNLQQTTAATPINTEEHGSRRLCFCF